MFLSQLTLIGHHNRTRSEFDRPYELHRTLSKGWVDFQSARVLFRPEREQSGMVRVIVQSLKLPDWSRLNVPKGYLRNIDGPKELKLDRLCSGQRLRFRLRCNPSKRIRDKSSSEIGKRRVLIEKADVINWLKRKAEAGGFLIKDAGFDRIYWYDSKRGIQNKPLCAVLFDGILQVTDPELFRNTIASGIGPGKAFGFGLLSVARANFG